MGGNAGELPETRTQVYPGSACRNGGGALVLQSHYSKAKPAVYRIQSESRVLSSLLSASWAAPVWLYIGSQTRVYRKEYVETKESITILGRQVIRLLLQAVLRTGP